MKVNAFLIILLFTFQGCYTKYKLTPNGYYIPSKARFSFDKTVEELKDTSTLSITSIYECTCETPEWFKFFKDGHVFVGYGDRMLRPSGDTVYGLAGFYKLQGNLITMEILNVEKDSYFVMLEGKIENDNIIVTRKHVKNMKGGVKPGTFEGPYRRLKINVNLPSPDW